MVGSIPSAVKGLNYVIVVDTGSAAVRHSDISVILGDNTFSANVCLGAGALHPIVQQLAAAHYPERCAAV